MKMFEFNLIAMVLLMQENPSTKEPLAKKGYGNIDLNQLKGMLSMGERINGKLKIAIRTIYTSIKNGDDTRLQNAYNVFAEKSMGREAMRDKIFKAISEKQDCADVSAESDPLSQIIQEAVNKGFAGEAISIDEMSDHLEYSISMLTRAKNVLEYLDNE